MATSLEQSEKEGENLVKISPVDPEIICLDIYFKMKKKKINASRTYSPRAK